MKRSVVTAVLLAFMLLSACGKKNTLDALLPQDISSARIEILSSTSQGTALECRKGEELFETLMECLQNGDYESCEGEEWEYDYRIILYDEEGECLEELQVMQGEEICMEGNFYRAQSTDTAEKMQAAIRDAVKKESAQ